ncbi:hypothetical protein [Pedobacter miscanthi]|uniref:Uncharacterized protein n=1 Tax=Pedobacter miscanthi TaxID=2259170 RepID=A0A366L173_9SPHI|nr:hypothetical protein [Pedobacter miscanthi]RBQ07596.1 hypothetical protein DRW42_10430 [Pedobacter miscanthi]
MKSRKLMLSLVALVGFGSFVTLNAFKNVSKTPTVYQYLSSSSDEEDLHNINNWEEVDGSTPGCGTSGNLVCRYSFEGNISEFEEFIEDKTPVFLTDNALTKKP